MRQTLLPVGEYTKPEVRELARRFDLPVASRADSQDLCFLAGRDYRGFLNRNAPQTVRPGKIVDTAGQESSASIRAWHFIPSGSAKGWGIASPEPLYVLKKDLRKNVLVVGAGRATWASASLLAAEINWMAGEPPAGPLQAQVKIRYKANEAAGRGHSPARRCGAGRF